MGRIVDITGQRFGKLVVIERTERPKNRKDKCSYWLCQCDCGNKFVAPYKHLVDSNTQSCGCMRSMEDIVGQRFGRLTVVCFSHRSKTGKYFWKCICDCGNTKTINVQSLRSGYSKSCGCLAIEVAKDRIPKMIDGNIKDAYEVFLGQVYAQYKSGAARRNLSFEITKDKFDELIHRPCFYCGTENDKTRESKGMLFSYTGIDRIDSLKGYIEGNVVTCCSKCNTAKLDLKLDDFADWVKRVYTHMFIEGGNFGKEVTAISNLQI